MSFGIFARWSSKSIFHREWRRTNVPAPTRSFQLMRITVLIAAALTLTAVAGAQTTLGGDAELRASPDGKSLGVVRAGATLRTGTSRGGATEVTVEGFLRRTAVGGKRDGFSVSVKANGVALLRASGDRDGRVIARLQDGVGVARLSTSGDWVRVRRTGWLKSAALRPPPTARPASVAAVPPRPATARPAPPDSVSSAAGSLATGPSDFTTTHRAPLAGAPEGRSATMLDSGVHVHALSRDRGWVRVQVDGWVRERDLVPADTSIHALTAAQIRAEPDANRGKTVRWNVQMIALQRADPLRHNLAPDEPYLLARGPGTENALLYLALPPSLVERARSLHPLQSITVTARVRVGRSDPSGVPILDVQSIADQ